jgi:hypothetical protein
MSMRAVVFSFAALILAVLALHISPARADWYSTGPIWSEVDAQRICTNVCHREGWNGRWKTVYVGRTSACFCNDRGGRYWSAIHRLGPRICIETDPIRSSLEAKMICPGACGSGKWDGSWRRIDSARATCGCAWHQPPIFDPI